MGYLPETFKELAEHWFRYSQARPWMRCGSCGAGYIRNVENTICFDLCGDCEKWALGIVVDVAAEQVLLYGTGSENPVGLFGKDA